MGIIFVLCPPPPISRGRQLRASLSYSCPRFPHNLSAGFSCMLSSTPATSSSSSSSSSCYLLLLLLGLLHSLLVHGNAIQEDLDLAACAGRLCFAPPRAHVQKRVAPTKTTPCNDTTANRHGCMRNDHHACRPCYSPVPTQPPTTGCRSCLFCTVGTSGTFSPRVLAAHPLGSNRCRGPAVFALSRNLREDDHQYLPRPPCLSTARPTSPTGGELYCGAERPCHGTATVVTGVRGCCCQREARANQVPSGPWLKLRRGESLELRGPRRGLALTRRSDGWGAERVSAVQTSTVFACRV